MKKINLKSSELTSTRKKRKSSRVALILGFLLVCGALGAYGTVLHLKANVERKIETAKSEMTDLQNKMSFAEVKEVYDFQGRLIAVEKFLGMKIGQGENLDEISARTLPETRFVELTAQMPVEDAREIEGTNKVSELKKVDTTKIKATIIVPDHYLLSQQIKSYNLMEDVQDVVLVSSKQEEMGVKAKISFSIKK